ncbi:MAG TPA: helix-turn-helix domain-containing protein [Candidatus Norongarragalinales archaeon]|nr:helix-turn-helix domain-containing protein [Candidatus Norongarragalinales archaeon]
MDRAIGESLGLTPAEAKVYLTLLELGPSAAGKIVKKAQFHRGSTYALLERLSEKGLVSQIKSGGRSIFSAQDPDVLLEILKERENRIAQLIPQLQKLRATRPPDMAATIYTGKKALQSVLEEMLHKLRGGGQYLDFGVSGLMREALGGYFILFHSKCRRSNVKSYVIFDEEVRKNGELLSIYHGERRFFPKHLISLTDTIIYNNTIVLFICTLRPPLAIVINDQATADSYKNIFRFMWRNSRD